jgi:CubicO group peptidase (beta-lactamase class C family)
MSRFPARRDPTGAALLSGLLAMGSLGAPFAAEPADAQITDRARLVAAMDSAAQAHVRNPMVAGVSVAVVRGGDTLLMKGYGMANLELSVPTPDDASASYEIGSITKQFTAAAVLKLVEQGKLDLDEDFTTYLPEFDTGMHGVPLRRLLDHTSGIRGYTEMPGFAQLAAKRLPRDTLVSLVEREPFDFEPGTAQIYNNSAFFLLGLIIEHVSGQSYEDFLQEQLFGPLGMTDTYYCSESAIREGKVTGYDGSPQGLQQKRYLDHTWPFAAGSLCSSAPDLVHWNQALHGGRVLQPESYTAMTTPMPLEDGSATQYAMGLGVFQRNGSTVISHGGGINGFLSDGFYMPDDRLVIIVLQNSTGPLGPGALTNAFTSMILGSVAQPVAVPYTGDLDALAGEYAGPIRGSHIHIDVSHDDGQLIIRPTTQQNGLRPVHVGDGVWVTGMTRRWFVMADGRAIEFHVAGVGSHYVLRRVR